MLGQALAQGDVWVRSHSERLLELGQLHAAEDCPFALPLALHAACVLWLCNDQHNIGENLRSVVT